MTRTRACLPTLRSAAPRAVALVLAAVATPAQATTVCAVLKSADGFATLRAAPSTTGAPIAKARAGEALVIQQHENGDQITSGRWLRVFHFPGDVVPPKVDPEFRKGRVGWMHRRYVGDCG